LILIRISYSSFSVITSNFVYKPAAPISEEERQRIKAEVKLERKRENAPKVAYKKRILHMSGRNGPRAVNGGGF
jgi:hypothetical protein